MLVKLPCGCIYESVAQHDDYFPDDYFMENMPPDTYREDACGCRRCVKCGSCVGFNLDHPQQSSRPEGPASPLGDQVIKTPLLDEFDGYGPSMVRPVTLRELAALKSANERNRKKAFRYEQALQDIGREMQFNSRSKTIKRKVLRVISKALGEVKK